MEQVRLDTADASLGRSAIYLPGGSSCHQRRNADAAALAAFIWQNALSVSER
jgi:hypothetical protein